MFQLSFEFSTELISELIGFEPVEDTTDSVKL